MTESVFVAVANLGVGALLGFIMFLVYRSDRKRSEECLDRNQQEIMDILKTNQEITVKATIAMEKHAEALKGMTDLLKVMYDSMRK